MHQFKVEYVFINVENREPVAGASITDGKSRMRIYVGDSRLDAFPAAKAAAEALLNKPGI